ncbi:Zn-ribbon domain-containing OB-fold protein [Cryptosporangium sp. NPDC048952]|uniref:Zn-ribbon domain-containing OB-fold protein n=1 Tax=Cryptosporangium sp. NPDC048952 TaxID=3363961 RepID=UPI0037242411
MIPPVPDELSAPHWEAAARGVLAVPRCADCEWLVLPPEPVCPQCGSVAPAYRYEGLSGRGTIRSWTVVRKSFLGEPTPFTVVDVELAEQPDLRMIGRLVHGEPHPGDTVTAIFPDGIPAWTT